jgi:hypothetical protein
LIKAGVSAAFATLCAAASAAASPIIPTGFALKASNGYTIHSIAFDGFDSPAELLLFAVRKDSGVSYFNRDAQIDETSIVADLGSVGSIDLEGEEGFMRARATRARADVRTTFGLICGSSGSEGVGGHSPGARFSIWRKRGMTRTEFVARKNSPTRVSRFEASIEERRGRLAISRGIKSTAPPGAFSFDVPRRLAVVRPPAPFAGEAAYSGIGDPPHGARGNLIVDFPGRAGVSLAGPGTRAGLVRYVDNPSHPFSLSALAARSMLSERKMFGGKPMKTAVYVDPEGTASDEALAGWVDAGADFASSLPPKPTK